jgi:CxxC motif-containing protein
MRMICINCPRGCELKVDRKESGEIDVAGNACARGVAYGRAEFENPTRMITGLVRVAGMRRPLPVKTRTAVPKGKINDVLAVLSQTTVQLPVRIGDVIISDVSGTGVDVVATANQG